MRRLRTYLPILLILVGFFSPVFAPVINAQISPTQAAGLITPPSNPTTTTTSSQTTAQQSVSSAQSNLTAAQATLSSDQADLDNGENDVDATQIVNDQAAVNTAQTNLTTAQNQLQAANTDADLQNDPESACGVLSFWNNIAVCIINPTIQAMGTLILEVTGICLWISGVLLNLTLQVTVVDMHDIISQITGITTAWTAVRDFINLFFIFVLLYTAIGTIVGAESVNWKKTIGRLVIAAIFINFSLFMTKVIIDLSNVTSYGIYQTMVSASDTSTSIGNIKQVSGLSGTIMQQMNLQSIFATDQATTRLGGAGSVLSTVLLTAVATFGGAMFIIITSFVFLAIAILFIVRFVMLIYLMVMSPLAFGGMVLPRLKKYSSDWWGSLTSQAVFAPIMMLMVWITLQIMYGLHTIPGLNGTSFNDVLANDASKGLGIIFNFVILICFMIGSIIIAKKLGAGGADFATKWAGKATFSAAAAVGQNTIGRIAHGRANDEKLLDDAKYKTGLSGVYARTKLAAYKNVAGSSFDVRAATGKGAGLGAPDKALAKGFSGRLEDRTKKAQKAAEKEGATEEQKKRVGEERAKWQAEAVKRAEAANPEDAKKRDELQKVIDAQSTIPEGSREKMSPEALQKLVSDQKVYTDRINNAANSNFGAVVAESRKANNDKGEGADKDLEKAIKAVGVKSADGKSALIESNQERFVAANIAPNVVQTTIAAAGNRVASKIEEEFMPSKMALFSKSKLGKNPKIKAFLEKVDKAAIIPRAIGGIIRSGTTSMNADTVKAVRKNLASGKKSKSETEELLEKVVENAKKDEGKKDDAPKPAAGGGAEEGGDKH